ncbi:hypothetical protein NEOLEDRAFT_1128858 [Neolentinus lepideus HHB14362 ss-1]|uniref:Uncharacterized protein n=1 Tax=Neolentinus lepideus HHB14362 ss-1 TaxID=1314782 RepID=A0A165UTR0_9AGAM|nr:hypothetical protein NEOLEDRAFT_1128858 [Neolentinus lepideus HHB14362 ss-1]
MEETSESWTEETRAAFLKALDMYPASADSAAKHDSIACSSSPNDARDVVQASTLERFRRLCRTRQAWCRVSSSFYSRFTVLNWKKKTNQSVSDKLSEFALVRISVQQKPLCIAILPL